MTIDRDMTFEAYLAAPAYGSSDIKAFKHGPPAMVQWHRKNRGPGTQSTIFGTTAHHIILTPQLLANHVVRPDCYPDFRTKAAQKWRDDTLASGKTITTQAELAKLTGILLAWNAKHAASKSLDEAEGVEASVFWDCVESGLPCRARPDWWDAHAVYDMKVSIAADWEFGRMVDYCQRMGWFNQLAHNRAGLRANGFPRIKVGRNVLISPNEPHNIHLIEVREHDMDFLEMSNENTRRGMAVCHASGEWPGTPATWTEIELPMSAAFTEDDLQGAEAPEDETP